MFNLLVLFEFRLYRTSISSVDIIINLFLNKSGLGTQNTENIIHIKSKVKMEKVQQYKSQIFN